MARITVEDCLTRENNRFALVMLSTYRTKQLLGGAKSVTDSKGNKAVVTSLREIAAGKVRFMSEADLTEEKRIQEEAQRRASEEAAVELPVASAGEPQNGTHLHRSDGSSNSSGGSEGDGEDGTEDTPPPARAAPSEEE